jgi:hypothetical protein
MALGAPDYYTTPFLNRYVQNRHLHGKFRDLGGMSRFPGCPVTRTHPNLYRPYGQILHQQLNGLTTLDPE